MTRKVYPYADIWSAQDDKKQNLHLPRNGRLRMTEHISILFNSFTNKARGKAENNKTKTPQESENALPAGQKSVSEFTSTIQSENPAVIYDKACGFLKSI